ncbi:MAG: hypothetical protein WCI67_09500 [Chloroflexales bacterium]
MITRLPIRQIWSWCSGLRLPRLLVSAALLGALALGVVMALRALQPAAPAQILPGQALAWDIARAAARSGDVQIASGAYLPGDRVLLYTRTSLTDQARIRSWALAQLGPFADRLAKLSARESLTWVIDYGADPGAQEAITVPVGRAADPAYYRYVSASPGLLAAGAAAPPAAAAPTGATAQPAAQPAQPAPAGATAAAAAATTAPAAVDGQPLLTTSFDESAGAASIWLPLSGTWTIAGGIYSQSDNSGYDFISMMNLAPQAHYRLDAKLRLGDGQMGGGFIYNAPSTASRAGAQNVDFDQKGGFLRWGRYDDKGAYVYQGGVAIAKPISDGQWHNLSLVTHVGSSVISLDGQQIGTITNTSQAGHVGLITSVTKVDFDSVQLSVLPETAGAVAPVATALPAATATITTSAGFSDDFADGNTQGWQVLSGTWQNIAGVYQQTDLTGSDLGSVTPFQSGSYTATVRLQRLDGDIGAGFYFNMAQRDSKSRSQMINYTQGGKALQWGHFDEGGNFVFEGSAPVADGNDGQWHTIGMSVAGGKATFSMDGNEVATDVSLTYASGYVGLLASHSKVAFDDVQIKPQ